MNLTQEELNALKSTHSECEWNTTCDQIKRARDGQYPADWYAQVLATGLIRSVQSNWK